MPIGHINSIRSKRVSHSFNMTPIIDIVFLLIIFFLVVSRFIEAENFPVTVPDDCRFARTDHEPATQITTLTVMNDPRRVSFAVGTEEILPHDDADLRPVADRLAEMIDARLMSLPLDDRTVTLRIDKDITYAKAQYALAAVAQSTATDIRLAVLGTKLQAGRSSPGE